MGEAPKLTGPDLTAGIEISRLPENIPLLGHANGAAVFLVRKESEIHALGATCSHYSGPLAEGLIVGQTVRCPWHHACFDLRTGEALGAPALEPIPCYEVFAAATGFRSEPNGPCLHCPRRRHLPRTFVIAGAGAAGAAAAEKLRRLGHAGAITLIGNEAPGPIDRPNLSKDFLAGNAPMEWMTSARRCVLREARDRVHQRRHGRGTRSEEQVNHARERTQGLVRQVAARNRLGAGAAADRRGFASTREDVAYAGRCAIHHRRGRHERPPRRRRWLELHRARSRGFIALAKPRGGRS